MTTQNRLDFEKRLIAGVATGNKAAMKEIYNSYTPALNGFVRLYLADPNDVADIIHDTCLLYTSPSPRDRTRSRMPSSA